MPRPKSDLQKVTIRLYTGDKDDLDSLFPRLGYNKVIREHVRRLVTIMKERDPAGPATLPEVNLEDLAHDGTDAAA